MTRGALAALLALAACAEPRAAEGRRAEARGARGEIVLDGERVPVRWTDGDSFRIAGGRLSGAAARLVGVDALEVHGPVHRIGGMSGRELLAIAKGTAALAAARVWSCATEGRRDRYRRLLVDCPEAAEALVRAGHAMVFSLEGPPAERLLAAQREAQRERAGMWGKGAPPLVPASLHSADEPGLGPRGAYDRVVDTRTGLAVARAHARTYATCEEVCVGEGEAQACMTYVPFDRRYRRRPGCLR